MSEILGMLGGSLIEERDGVVFDPYGRPLCSRGQFDALFGAYLQPVDQQPRTAAVGRRARNYLSKYLGSKGLWNDPGSGKFIKKGMSTEKALSLIDSSPGAAVRALARDAGHVMARVTDNRMRRGGYEKGSLVEVHYKDETKARVRIASGRWYDVSWDRFEAAPLNEPGSDIEWRDSFGAVQRRAVGRARGQWIEEQSSDHYATLPDGRRLHVYVDAEVRRRNVRPGADVAVGPQGENLEIRGELRSGQATWATSDPDGTYHPAKITVAGGYEMNDELEMEPGESVEDFRERAKTWAWGRATVDDVAPPVDSRSLRERVAEKVAVLGRDPFYDPDWREDNSAGVALVDRALRPIAMERLAARGVDGAMEPDKLVSGLLWDDPAAFDGNLMQDLDWDAFLDVAETVTRPNYLTNGRVSPRVLVETIERRVGVMFSADDPAIQRITAQLERLRPSMPEPIIPDYQLKASDDAALDIIINAGHDLKASLDEMLAEAMGEKLGQGETRDDLLRDRAELLTQLRGVAAEWDALRDEIVAIVDHPQVVGPVTWEERDAEPGEGALSWIFNADFTDANGTKFRLAPRRGWEAPQPVVGFGIAAHSPLPGQRVGETASVIEDPKTPGRMLRLLGDVAVDARTLDVKWKEKRRRLNLFPDPETVMDPDEARAKIVEIIDGLHAVPETRGYSGISEAEVARIWAALQKSIADDPDVLGPLVGPGAPVAITDEMRRSTRKRFQSAQIAPTASPEGMGFALQVNVSVGSGSNQRYLTYRVPIDPELATKLTATGAEASGRAKRMAEARKKLQPNVLAWAAEHVGGNASPQIRAGAPMALSKMLEDVGRVIPDSVKAKVAPVGLKGTRGRAHYSPREREIVTNLNNPSTMLHEFGHHVEKLDELNRALWAYYVRRTGGVSTPTTKLTTLFPGDRYRSNEEARPDEFFSSYAGKSYGGTTSRRSTSSYELFTMGLQGVFFGDTGRRKGSDVTPREIDPDYAAFMLGLLAWADWAYSPTPMETAAAAPEVATP